MQIIRIKNLTKNASLSLYIKDFTKNRTFETIYNIGYYLNYQLFSSWLSKQDLNYFNEFHSSVPQNDIITMDGHDVDSPTGIINFYIDGINPDKIDFIVEQITSTLKKNNIVIGNISKNQSRIHNVPVIRIPIIKNPNVSEDNPPEINMANNNAFFIFNKILKYDKNLWENDAFNAKELKKRINYFLGETNLEEGQYAGQSSIVLNPREGIFNEDFLSGKNAISNYDEEKVRHILNLIDKFCDWAISHGFEEIFVA